MDEFCVENPVNGTPTHGRQVRLLPLDPTSPRYAEIERLFRKGWQHLERARPDLRAIYKLVSPQSVLQPYQEYKESLLQPSLSLKFPARGIEHLLFHGTTRACLLGENSHNVLPCSLPECSLCTIIRESFDLNKCGLKHKFSRFGTGIYTSACSSKADDYVRNLSEDAVRRVLLLNRVIVGRPKKLRTNAVDLTGPPSGYHSVIGKPGVDLNYEETVIYNNDAIRPSYVLVYGGPPKQEVRNKLEVTLRKLFTTPLA